MALQESPTYKALTKSSNLMWGGDKFLMKTLLVVSVFLIFGVKGWVGYLLGGLLLFFGRMALVKLAQWDEDALPILFQNFTLKKFYLGRGIYPGTPTNIIFSFNMKKFRVVAGTPWYWRIFYFIFPTSIKHPKPSKQD